MLINQSDPKVIEKILDFYLIFLGGIKLFNRAGVTNTSPDTFREIGEKEADFQHAIHESEST